MRRAAWVALVFSLTLLVELPASWLLKPVAAQGVSGSLWQGQAQRIGQVGPVAWHWQPWRLQARLNIGFQGQDWQVRLAGWPWDWQARVEPLGVIATEPSNYRLSGAWRGRVDVQGSGGRCRVGEGAIGAAELILVSPWSLSLGASQVRIDCSTGLHLLAQLQLQGQHQFSLDADLMQRRGRLQGVVEPGATLAPLLQSGQWLKPDQSGLSRTLKW
ncbi:type II secretion system protein N [Pseudomonas rubra]|uniref:Type II secretion system protein N n=1 Tax=Pseudomonas rubra TaxID=2942627 RepID=A0ABT5P7P7_9PSED|nr:type II secretion system protein N [Pseudomonas rubra]MDD1014260.1 type II secretion system protein N [Pseudomonas rubra]MDD1037625.1 type II secretion system protein N [Pseudomonas rubra]MDD1155721.1 type II secretion system protein N [Pseudomonas rubra]